MLYYKPIAVISTKLLKMSSFCQNMACGYRKRAEVHLSDIYVWRLSYIYRNVGMSSEIISPGNQFHPPELGSIHRCAAGKLDPLDLRN